MLRALKGWFRRQLCLHGAIDRESDEWRFGGVASCPHCGEVVRNPVLEPYDTTGWRDSGS